MSVWNVMEEMDVEKDCSSNRTAPIFERLREKEKESKLYATFINMGVCVCVRVCVAPYNYICVQFMSFSVRSSPIPFFILVIPKKKNSQYTSLLYYEINLSTLL